MKPRFSQWLPGEEIPEKHWMYRLAKKYWFSDFGAYRNANHSTEIKRAELKSKLDQIDKPNNNLAHANR
jgi:hypothetical protein